MDDFDTDLDSNDDFDCEDEEDYASECAEIHGLTLTDADVEVLCDYLDCEDADVDAEIVDCMERENCGGAMVLMGARMKAAGINVTAVQGGHVAPADATAVATLKLLFASRK